MTQTPAALTLTEVSHALVTTGTMAMVFHALMSTSVLPILVTPMLHAQTLMEVTPAHVTTVSLETVPLVKILTNALTARTCVPMSVSTRLDHTPVVVVLDTSLLVLTVVPTSTSVQMVLITVMPTQHATISPVDSNATAMMVTRDMERCATMSTSATLTHAPLMASAPILTVVSSAPAAVASLEMASLA